jgi:hypothetical protein
MVFNRPDFYVNSGSSGLAEKVLATKEGAYEALVVAGGKLEKDNLAGLEAVVRALASLLNGNPDPLDQSGFAFIKGALETSAITSNNSLVDATLELILFCCVRHEQNRQNLVRSTCQYFKTTNFLLDQRFCLFD